VIVYRAVGPSHPFLWDSTSQPPARWHEPDDAPVQYFSDTPEGAWAEVLRHFHLTQPDDLEGLAKSLWTVRLPDDLRLADPDLPTDVLTGGYDTYPACREEAERIRRAGFDGIIAPSAALIDSRPWLTRGGGIIPSGIRPEPAHTIVLFGEWSGIAAHQACWEGRPADWLQPRVRWIT
jgi:hypothetical protein